MMLLLFHSAAYYIPIDDAPKSIYMIGATVLVVEIVSMFPNVEAQQRGETGTHRVTSVRFFSNV